MSDDCENLRYNFLECVRNVHIYTNVKECFQYWDELIQCVNKDIKVDIKDAIKKIEYKENVIKN